MSRATSDDLATRDKPHKRLTSLGAVSGLFTPGSNVHVRVVVSGDTYSAYLNGATDGGDLGILLANWG